MEQKLHLQPIEPMANHPTDHAPNGPRRWRDIVFLPRQAVEGEQNDAILSEYFDDMDVLEAIHALTAALQAALSEAELEITPEPTSSRRH